MSGATKQGNQKSFTDSEKSKDTRLNNIIAAKGIADVVRTSLGPRGMDKMIQDSKGKVLITNDGATILKKMAVVHPTARMLVEISKAQDIEAGDGTTTVVVIAGALLSVCQKLLQRGIHPAKISEGFNLALQKCLQIIESMGKPISLTDRASLIESATTSLSSKVVSSHSEILAPMAVDAVLKILQSTDDTNVDLRDINVNKKKGGTIDDSELIDGLCFVNKKASHQGGGPTRVMNAKIGFIQFCISAPKTDMENNVVVHDYVAMDRILKEERRYIITLIKKIADSGCNVLIIQKSILRDAVNELALHFLAKKNIMVIKDIERDSVDFISKTIGCTPIAHIDQFTKGNLGEAAEVVENVDEKIIKFLGVKNPGKTVSILVRASNLMILDETERSLHDALCVVRSLVKNKSIVPGGACVEMECAQKLQQYSREIYGVDSYIVKAYGDALESIPATLAENAGLDPVEYVTELRNRHIKGEIYAGLNLKKNTIADMYEANVIQPSLVSISAITLATECVRMILKIDDIVISR